MFSAVGKDRKDLKTPTGMAEGASRRRGGASPCWSPPPAGERESEPAVPGSLSPHADVTRLLPTGRLADHHVPPREKHLALRQVSVTLREDVLENFSKVLKRRFCKRCFSNTREDEDLRPEEAGAPSGASATLGPGGAPCPRHVARARSPRPPSLPVSSTLPPFGAHIGPGSPVRRTPCDRLFPPLPPECLRVACLRCELIMLNLTVTFPASHMKLMFLWIKKIVKCGQFHIGQSDMCQEERVSEEET